MKYDTRRHSYETWTTVWYSDGANEPCCGDLGDTGARLVWAGIGFMERLCLLVLSQIRIWANIAAHGHTGAS